MITYHLYQTLRSQEHFISKGKSHRQGTKCFWIGSLTQQRDFPRSSSFPTGNGSSRSVNEASTVISSVIKSSLELGQRRLPFPLWLPEHSLSSHGWTNLMQHGASPQSESQMECRCGSNTDLTQTLQLLFPFMCVLTDMPACLYMCVHAFVLFMCTYMYVNVCLCSYVCMCMSMYTGVYVSVYMWACTYVCTMTGGTYMPITTT